MSVEAWITSDLHGVCPRPAVTVGGLRCLPVFVDGVLSAWLVYLDGDSLGLSEIYKLGEVPVWVFGEQDQIPQWMEFEADYWGCGLLVQRGQQLDVVCEPNCCVG